MSERSAAAPGASGKDNQHLAPKSDIEISQAAKMRPIIDVARDKLGIPAEHVQPYGHYKGKISLDYISSLDSQADGKLILVTAITPTPAGEGKTTTTVGLGDGAEPASARRRLCWLCASPRSVPVSASRAALPAAGALRRSCRWRTSTSTSPATSTRSASAHNLLSALIDNHIYWGNELSSIDERRIAWRRVDGHERPRACGPSSASLGGVANGFPREDGFDITVASEDHGDLLPRLRPQADLREAASATSSSATRVRGRACAPRSS